MSIEDSIRRFAPALRVEIAARYALNSYVPRVFSACRTALEPYLGKKLVKKTDGKFVSAFAAKMQSPDFFPKFPDENGRFRMSSRYLNSSRSTLFLDLQVYWWVPGPGCDHGNYIERHLCLGDLSEGGCLTLLKDPPEAELSFNPNDVENAMRRLAELAKESSTLFDTCVRDLKSRQSFRYDFPRDNL